MDDFPEFSTDELLRWLDAKYSRHGEIEDGVAAVRLRSLTDEIEQKCKDLVTSDQRTRRLLTRLEDAEAALLKRDVAYKSIYWTQHPKQARGEITKESGQCRHPVHNNPGLIAPCPECGATPWPVEKLELDPDLDRD